MSLIVAAWLDTFEHAESAARALPAAGATAGGATSPPLSPAKLNPKIAQRAA